MKLNITIAIALVVILAAWLALGPLITAQEPPGADESTSAKESQPPAVRVRDSSAKPFAPELRLRGKTEPARSSVLHAEVSGPVAEIAARRGTRVAQGDPLVRLHPQTLPEQVEAAETLLEQRQMEFSAAEQLQVSGYQSQTRLAESAALLAQARNQLATARLAVSNLEIRAPYDGVFNERLVEVGEFVNVGDPVASMLELDPLVVVAHATEIEVGSLHQGQPARARIGGEEVEGVIRYVSQSADQAVRTYVVEFEFPNSDLRFRAGQTADLIVATDTRSAHLVSPALLFLSANTAGELGLKVVQEDDRVAFYPTEILGSSDQGLWVAGLPETARIITVGQGFVKEGARVSPVDEASIP